MLDLYSMGFTDFELNNGVLKGLSNNLEEAINFLVQLAPKDLSDEERRDRVA